MRLLHTNDFELSEFVGGNNPRYAILSHTWCDGEILFGDVQRGRSQLLACGKPGLAKVLKAAEVAKNNDYDYIWIDTCCIDKSSSAELSEAINSMFAWYRDAAVCYACISDFQTEDPQRLSSRNRWFTRGWTPQELIAPCCRRILQYVLGQARRSG
ncbi:HET-domain-containing protein (Fragment) [Madurella fahalii]|uniref:HET-domain-containing protein n=1 Tax=Madurella fahalii TaxID=1157608 RepID=A0ABQ0G6C4_9PEZI